MPSSSKAEALGSIYEGMTSYTCAFLDIRKPEQFPGWVLQIFSTQELKGFKHINEMSILD